MISRPTSCVVLVVAMALSFTPIWAAAEASGQPVGKTDATGTLSPVGPPRQPPTRANAGGGCVVDLVQVYDVTGELLLGFFEVDFRILVNGPCEDPPKLGKYDEEWIAYGKFSGSFDGVAASSTLIYTARVRAGGDVQGRIILAGEVFGELVVTGNLGDGALSYSGKLDLIRN